VTATDRARILEVLRKGEMEVLGRMPRASNVTLAVRLTLDDADALAVYKPQAGESPLWDFPEGTLYRREVAAFLVSESTGFGFVPPTVSRAGVYGVGSVQLAVAEEPAEHYLTLMPAHAETFRRVCAFDVAVNNADRKSGHCMIERETGSIRVIDHGTCFGVQDKLRTVIWDFAGERLPDEVRGGLDRFLSDAACARALTAFLAADEIAATRARTEALLRADRFPDPPEDRRPYPWPPI